MANSLAGKDVLKIAKMREENNQEVHRLNVTVKRLEGESEETIDLAFFGQDIWIMNNNWQRNLSGVMQISK